MRVASYNILAPSYARPERYPFTDPLLLAWEARRDRLMARIVALDPDVLCLQEVEEYIFRYLQARLEPYGFGGEFAQKGQNRPDGCAIFHRTDRLEKVDSRRLGFHDGDDGPHSGHVALMTRFRDDDRLLTVTNTHIRWDEPDVRGRDHVGYREAVELVGWIEANAAQPSILCGDFNAWPEHDIIRKVLAAGFIDAYASAPQPTANSDCRAKRIDYILHTAALASRPEPIPVIDDETPLPSETEPSDHLPVCATLTLA